MLEVKGISVRYHIIPVLHEVSFEVLEGQVVAIVGVGHRLTAAGSPLRGLFTSKLPRFSGSLALGVGHNPDPIPFMRRSHLRRR